MSYRTRSKNFLAKAEGSNGEIQDGDNEEKYDSSSELRHSSFRFQGSKVPIYWRYIVLLSLLWVFVVHYYERVVVKRSMNVCQWKKWEQWSEGDERHRVALFADPQIMDNHSYPGRPAIVNHVTRLILDNYHKRDWKFVQYHLDPDTNFFLGDLFDGGRYWDDDYWHKEYIRFNSIFPKKPMRRTVMSLPGNHDIGFGDTIIESSLKRFSTYFGETSNYLNAGNHTFVLLDTISLSDKQNVNISNVPKQFLEDFASVEHEYPRILLSHVPLYRNPEQQKCGSLRESNKPFPLMKGIQYQTVIDQEISQEVLTKVQPSILFSGDDHDYCHITHSYLANGESKVAEEITVKSCAMNMGISRPAIQLLSLHNPSPAKGAVDTATAKTYQTNICYMPDPYKAMKAYVFTLIITVILSISIYFFPAMFNKKVVLQMEKKFKKPYVALPLPVSTSLDPSSWLVTSAYYVNENSSILGFLIHAIIMTLSILSIFTFYYSTV
ncbi:hypothetical protein Kpol_1030p6 [Vanderwaltozyma polyspora DSM 70294]|uniref:Calcineurin-like phosphoesterase domain-containing protein n=1 Tax=Vanderwaltozyma polyspora (strain ATCC 22028 / DSM 70294 / BCRC 21397 / CBS 2163 / NBRC 10782 / NRRL Y-8283 / UCD 57-17) TaxID=436907 RepID=A7TMS6_VANPO|nr:uncharacterized protein Kpol_1030p6 [Vanderwaltozyma polyspora DSM 70294]EDO16398.1 hypothetical protein Kpol_1030p6 [Vanderwaltozyma polyspora DSM 70294]